MKATRRVPTAITAGPVILLLVWANTAAALTSCRARIRGRDGVVLVNARGVSGTLLWGYEQGKEARSFADPGCVSSGKARRCELGAEGTPERITPPELCTLYLKDDAGTCQTYVRRCIPGKRSICPSDMVRVGSICVDKYEASVWSSPTGGTLYGAGSDDYPCNDNGQDCTNIYARSVKNMVPARYITWFQAQQACGNVGKRLPTNAEWQMAVAGTPDTGGADDGSTTCNTDELVPGPGVAYTGSRSACVSNSGAYDMVGNLSEWAAEWVPRSTALPGWGAFSDDYMALAGASTTDGPGVITRGSDWRYRTSTGPFAISAAGSLSTWMGHTMGFRCVR